VFVTNGSENKTYSGLLGQRGELTTLQTFAQRGSESVVAGGQGRVFIANGQIFVHAQTGAC